MDTKQPSKSVVNSMGDLPTTLNTQLRSSLLIRLNNFVDQREAARKAKLVERRKTLEVTCRKSPKQLPSYGKLIAEIKDIDKELKATRIYRRQVLEEILDKELPPLDV